MSLAALPTARRVAGWFLVGLLLLLSAPAVRAWGPHPAITQAALDALGTNHPLVVHLGAQAQRLTNYAWMADYRRLPFEEPDGWFYADDYLLFPGAPVHWDHICPEVNRTFRPYFLRAVQALRTETPANAARWIGSLLHFVEDAGSPPHAAEIRGPTHTKMENWVDAEAIRIPGYQPVSFGATEDAALAKLLERMDGLIAFSKQRARKARIHVEIGNRGAVKPVVLEAALETSRVVADLLHTLGQVGLAKAADGAGGSLRGSVSATDPPGMERFPAKVLLEGTLYSTLADAAGQFEFRNLPPGNYRLAAFRPGTAIQRTSVELKPGSVAVSRLFVRSSELNLIRNPDFALRWVSPGAPDCWSRLKNAWEGEVIALKAGQRYRLRADFKPDADGEVIVRWTDYLPHARPRFAPMPRFQTRTLTPRKNEFVFTGAKDMGLLQLSLRCGDRPPERVWSRLSLVPIAGAGE